MTFFDKVKLFFGRVGFRFYMQARIYQIWSKMYQFLFQRQREELRTFNSLKEFVDYIHTLKWRADSWLELGDAFSHPNHVQWIANHDPARLIGDCDDFAAWECAVVNADQAAGKKLFPEIENHTTAARILTVTWFSPEYGFGGHNVCLLTHVSSIDYVEQEVFKTKLWLSQRYMDYGYPSQSRATIEEVVRDVLDTYATGAVNVGWVVSDANLTPETFGILR